VRVIRPVVRSFSEQDAAATHVRAGGHAVLWESSRKAWLVVCAPDPADLSDLNLWSILDLGLRGYARVLSGALEGLAVRAVPRHRLRDVRHRIERDSVHRGPRREIDLDCLECGACCRAHKVVLIEDDVARFDAAGRCELHRRPFARRDRKNRLVLAASRSGDCKHLGSKNRCGIYPIRPHACRCFPVGSEGCLSARVDQLGCGGPRAQGHKEER
jgi:uncharacterized protein